MESDCCEYHWSDLIFHLFSCTLPTQGQGLRTYVYLVINKFPRICKECAAYSFKHSLIYGEFLSFWNFSKFHLDLLFVEEIIVAS